MAADVPASSKPTLIDREGALELNDGESEQDERGPLEPASEDQEWAQALPSVEGLVTLGSEDAPVCSDGICF